MDLPLLKTLPITQIQPYFQNPRRIPQEAVDAVAESIEKYGYVQPIVVDSEDVVVVGHTRLKALEQLGVTEVEVYVSTLDEDKIREYRLADNRTGEMSSWDHNALVLELREFETGLAGKYFPDVDLEIEQLDAALNAVNQQDIDEATKKATTIPEAATLNTVEVKCPSCYGTFEVRSESLPGLSKGEVARMKAGGA